MRQSAKFAVITLTIQLLIGQLRVVLIKCFVNLILQVLLKFRHKHQ